MPKRPSSKDDAGVDFSEIIVTKKDTEIDSLATKLQSLEDSRKEERFGWIVALLALINYILLKDIESTLTPLVVLILELIALLILARKSGIEYIEIIISRLISSVTNKISK